MTRRPPGEWTPLADEIFLVPDPDAEGGWAPGIRVTVTADRPWLVSADLGAELRNLVRSRITLAEIQAG